MVEDVVPMAGTSRMVDDEVPISVEGSSRIIENQIPVGSVVAFFFFNYWTKDKIFIIIRRFHPAYWHTIKWGSRGRSPWLAKGPPKAGLAASVFIKIYRNTKKWTFKINGPYYRCYT